MREFLLLSYQSKIQSSLDGVSLCLAAAAVHRFCLLSLPYRLSVAYSIMEMTLFYCRSDRCGRWRDLISSLCSFSLSTKLVSCEAVFGERHFLLI